jgi:hypothetical protein
MKLHLSSESVDWILTLSFNIQLELFVVLWDHIRNTTSTMFYKKTNQQHALHYFISYLQSNILSSIQP